jgi:hypothetical protein
MLVMLPNNIKCREKAKVQNYKTEQNLMKFSFTICLSLEEVIVCAGHKVLTEVGNYISLIVAN